jgi:four helix bundle protein
MQDPNKLAVTEHAYQVAIGVYRLTETFPAGERFGLVQQMRRAAVSIGSNISEGCGRRGDRELLNSLYVAFAEAKELAFQLRVSDGLRFGGDAERQKLRSDLDRLERMLNRLTTYLRAHSDRKTKKAPVNRAPVDRDPTSPRSNEPTHVRTAATRR